MTNTISNEMSVKQVAKYQVGKLNTSMEINGNWDKPQWKDKDSISLDKHMGALPDFLPITHVKMMYDDNNLYLIFKVRDRFVSSTVTAFNGPVSADACVEFFFAPDIDLPLYYFNLEVNAGGTPLMAYHMDKRKNYKSFAVEDLKHLEIAHSLPVVIDPEITKPVVWTIEYGIPLHVLKQYGKISTPQSGVVWRANFYKTASKSSNPHWITWSFVDNEVPDFHLPEFFGLIEFE